MGIVDENGIVRRHWDHLDAPLHPAHPLQRPGSLLQGKAQRQSAADGPQGVIDGKTPRDGKAHPGDAAPDHRLKLHMFRKQADTLGGQVGRILIFRVGEAGTGRGAGVVPPRLVIQIHHRPAALAEELSLGRPVGLHGPMEIQMVLGQVGKDPHIERDARHPAELQRVGGDLHHHMGTPCVRHLSQEFLHLPALRGGAAGGQRPPADEVLIRADQTHPDPGGPLQHLFQKVGGGSLAVGTGDAHDGQALGRMAEPVGRGRRQSRPGVRDGQPGSRLTGRSLAHSQGSTPLQCLFQEAPPVGAAAGEGKKDLPGA